jgi:ubiquinone/menaquinone biosynthesis C-methylase UbiE
LTFAAKRRGADMCAVRYVKPSFPDDFFEGTAAYYAECRLSYPDALKRDLLERARISGKGRLLDLASGPGRVSLPLASSFKEVWAIDLEPEMIEAGKSEAEKIGADNVRWSVGRAEELQAEPGAFELITIGEAFHRLDQEVIAGLALRWLQPGGCLAILGWNSLVGGDAPWQRIVADITRSWKRRIAPTMIGDARENPGSGPEHDRSVFEDFGFEDVGNHEFPHDRERTVESIVGWLFSTSRFSEKVLGEKAKEFEVEITDALLAHDDHGVYIEHVQCVYTIGRRPEDR